jgi:pimeloyl-ACP methyl ester carboxylesterase
MRIVGMSLALSLIALPTGASAQSAPAPGALRLGPCKEEGISPPAKCGTYTVWENRDEKAGRTIDLSVVLLQARGHDRRPDPFVFLTGGPGEAATSIARGLDTDQVRGQRDILLVDQRGTGRSNGLYCGPAKTAPLQAFMPTMDAQGARACREAVEKRADLRYYLTTYAMDDLDDLRAALGYERINLAAASYGTRAALVYIRNHGTHVRSATLEASTALSQPMPWRFATDAEAALRNVLRECAAESACSATFPALEEDYRRTVQRIQQNGPMRTRIRDPRSGDSVEVSLRPADFAEALRGMLYDPQSARRIPLLLHAATTGDYRWFAQFQIERNLELAESIAEGLYFAVTCTEDVARVDPKAVYAAGRGTFLADYRAGPHIEGCESWPRGRLPTGFGNEVESDVPVLIVTGADDPATPPVSARAAASRLSNARVIIVPGGGHSVQGLVGADCVAGITQRFLETADARSLDTACVAGVHRRPFILRLDQISEGPPPS